MPRARPTAGSQPPWPWACRALGVLTIIGIVSATASASAQGSKPLGAELVVAEDSVCLNVEDLTFQVERALERPLRSAPRGRFWVRAWSHAQGLMARLEISSRADGTSGVRTLEAADCPALSGAVAVAVALALGNREEDDPTLSPEALRPSAPQDSGTSAALPEADPPPPSAADADHSAHGPATTALLGLVGDSGSLPGAGLGGSLTAELAWESAALRLVGTWLPKRLGQVDGNARPGAGAQLGLVAGALLACAPAGPPGAWLRLGACLGFELGGLSGRGTGVESPYERAALWSAARLELLGRHQLWQSAGQGNVRNLGVELGVTLLAPLPRDRFVLSGLGTVHEPDPVTARLSLALTSSL